MREGDFICTGFKSGDYEGSYGFDRLGGLWYRENE
jgi:hypothetical protein